MDQGIRVVIAVPRHEQRDQAGLGWESPRWRHDDAPAQGVVELERRFRNAHAPSQRGAIDEDQTIARDVPQPAPRRRIQTGVDWLGQTAVPRHGQVGVHEQARTIRAVFAEATAGYSAVGRLRAAGFQIDLAASINGDLIVSIQAARIRLDELAALLAAHAGRIEMQHESSAG